MCGTEKSGFAAADPSLFQGAPWVLTRSDPIVEELIRAVGAHPVLMEAELHDRLVAGASHAAYLLSVAYVLSLSEGGDWAGTASIAGTGFRDMSRLAAGDAELYAAIVAANREPIIAALQRVEASVAKVRRHLEASDPRLVELFEAAKTARDRWESDAGQG